MDIILNGDIFSLEELEQTKGPLGLHIEKIYISKNNLWANKGITMNILQVKINR